MRAAVHRSRRGPPGAAPIALGATALALLAGCGAADPKADPGCTPVVWYRDIDGDGVGDAEGPHESCEAPAGHAADAGDCDDLNPDRGPGAVERCDGVDDDCDGQIDEDAEGPLPTWYADADGDGDGDPLAGLEACAPPAGHAATGGDCDDADPARSSGGLDVPRDGVDQDCDGADATTLAERPFPGSLIASTDADLEAFCDAHDAVDGDLVLTGAVTGTAALSCLLEVRGSLLASADALEALELPALWWVGGDLRLLDNPALSSVQLDALRIVDGELGLQGSALLAAPTLPALALVGELTLVDAAELPALREVLGDVELRPGLALPALEDVGGRALAADLEQTELRLPALRRAALGLALLDLPALTTLELPALEELGELRIRALPPGLPVDLPALAAVDGDVSLSDCGPVTLGVGALGGGLSASDLPGFEAPSLTTVGGAVDVDAAEAIDLRALQSTGGDLRLRCPACSSPPLRDLATVGGELTVEDIDELTILELPSLSNVEGGLRLSGLPALDALRLPSLARLGGPARLGGLDALRAVALPALADLRDELVLASLPSLEEVDAAALGVPTLRSRVVVRDNPNLHTLELQDSAGGPGAIGITGNPALTELDLGAATSLGELELDADLVLLDLSALTDVAGGLFVRAPPLNALDLGALTRVGGDLTLRGALGALSLGALGEVGGALRLQPEAAPTIDLPALLTVGGSADLSAAAATTVDAPLLESVGGQLSFGPSGVLEAVSAPALQTAGSLLIAEDPALTSLDLQALASLGTDLSLRSLFSLPDLSGLSGLRTVGGGVFISGNTALTSVSGLGLVESVGGDVRIEGNVLLPTAAAQALVNTDIGRENIAGSVLISGNAP